MPRKIASDKGMTPVVKSMTNRTVSAAATAACAGRVRRGSRSVVAYWAFTFCLFSVRSLDAQAPLTVTTVSLDERGAITTTAGPSGPAFHPSRVLVRFRNGAQREFLPGSPSASDFPGDRNLHLVQNPPGISVAEAVARYRANPNVLYAEPDYIVHTDVSPNDPLWNQQWDMTKISAPTAWDTQTDSSNAVVAVIDTGIDFTHPDLQGNLWTNTDGSHGFNCIKGKCAKGGADDFGHGTHVAGTIGAVANNGIGMAGINWSVQLMSLKFLDSNGSGSTSDAVLAFDQVTALKKQGVNVRLTSNSWGGDGFSQSLKDAMTRGEDAGILHVCAAGNSSQNADSNPMYPAAYDNRGIISVLASDQNDVGATFTNYGLASVDIAAPGVSTLSTVPTGACTLCDPSGYKLLSGTSMATPHVTGVLAALFHQNPALKASEARDVVLNPRSYDTLSDAKAKSTSTGGRLNFAKALANPLLFAPVLNNFPTVTTGPDVFASGGSQVNLTATATDPDNDSLRTAWSPAASRRTQWLFGWMLSLIFPSLNTFAAPSIARTATVPYDVSVADGRGGGARANSSEYATVLPVLSPGQPTGSLTVSPTDAPVGSTITVRFPVKTSKNGQVGWDLWIGQQYATSGTCCFTGTSATFTLSTAGVYRIGTQAIDQQLNLSARQSAVVRIGGATGEPPIASATLDKLSGPIPLTVNIDMSASVDPDGSIKYYYFGCGDGTLTGSRSPNMSCSFSKPGPYWIMLMVQDNSGYSDFISAYVVATPAS
jgi:thermitase